MLIFGYRRHPPPPKQKHTKNMKGSEIETI